MTTLTRSQRGGAIALSLVCLSGTISLLYADVLIDRQPITLDHIVTGLVLAVAFLSGHFAWPMLRSGLYIPGATLGLVAVGALVLVVASSSGRQADVTSINKRAHTALASEFARLSEDVTAARTQWRKDKDAELAECVKVGPQCDLKTKRTIASWARVEALEARAETKRPVSSDGGKVRSLARLVSLLPWVSATVSELEETLSLALPYVVALVFEIGFLAAMHVVIGGRSETVSAPAPEFITAPPRKLPCGVTVDDVEALRRCFRSRSETLTNNQLATLMGVTKGESSKRVSAAVEMGLATRRKMGRTVAISMH